MGARRVADVYGEYTANELAMLAIDLLCEPPVNISTYKTCIPTRMIEDGRRILEEGGLDWEKLKGTEHSQDHKRQTEY